MIIDFCFRFFCNEQLTWDQYELLQSSGVTFITIEDTGKTWPTQDLKVGILQSSEDIYKDLYYYYDNHLLTVSPVILLMLTHLINDTLKQGKEETIYKILLHNRKLIQETIKGTSLSLTHTHAIMPVAWIKMNIKSLSANDFCTIAMENGLYILPGTNFFWFTRAKGNHFLRISLSRDVSVIEDGMKRLKNTLSTIA